VQLQETVVIVNPVARKLPARGRLQEADDWLREHGWKGQWLETAGPGDATRLAAQAAERRAPFVFVCGGDGTLNEAINWLAGTETAVGIIPAGTVNLWAREMRLLKRPADAVRLQLEGERRRVDLGRAGDRYFLLMAGYGVDAAVARQVSPKVKGRLGAAAYALAAAREAMRYRSSRTELIVDGETKALEVFMVLAGNTQGYAGVTKITPEARVDDGLLDICVYEGRTRMDIIAHAGRTLLRLHRGSRGVIYRRARHLQFVWHGRPLPAQLDGEPMEQSPDEVTVAPSSLWVAVPAGLKSPLFAA
jgi:diacylglycerol kinase (ATP)